MHAAHPIRVARVLALVGTLSAAAALGVPAKCDAQGLQRSGPPHRCPARSPHGPAFCRGIPNGVECEWPDRVRCTCRRAHPRADGGPTEPPRWYCIPRVMPGPLDPPELGA